MLKNVRTLVLLCVLAVFASKTHAATVSVTVNDNFFSQKDITVNVGDTVTWTWVGFGTHDCVADDGTWRSPLQSRGKTFSFTFTAANVGKHNYHCTPHQAIGMVGSVTVVGAANQPPTVQLTSPSGGATFLTTDTITFSANATDDAGVAKVEFFSDGNLIGAADTTSPYSVTSSLAAGTHSITAKATDTGGLSTTTSPIIITVNAPQNQPPTISLTAPTGGATFLTTDTITFSANANDDAGVAKVEFFSDGSLIGAADTTAPYSVSASLPAGTHSITATATDTGGLSTSTQPITITVSAPNQAPTVTLTSPQNGATFSPTDTITFSADAGDDVSVAKVEFFSDGNLIGFADTTAPYSVTGSLAAGQHLVTAKATDNAGLTTTTSPITINVTAGNSAPSVTLASAQAGKTIAAPASVTLSATATDDGAITQVEFFQQGVSVGVDTTVPYELTISNLTPGIYNFSATAKDNTGLTANSTTLQVRVAAEPHITFVTQNGSTITVVASATSGISHDLEGTTDFVNWTVVNTATANNGSVTLIDTINQAFRLYRVVAR